MLGSTETNFGNIFLRHPLCNAGILCILNCLAAYKATFGTLDNIKRAVKMVAFIQSAPDFYSQAQVANGGSQLLLDVIDAPAPARSAIGMAALPLNVPVEIEVVFEVE
jgi:enamine deaminase RidA (YjgF/YER057c/UK114 family)